MTASLWVEIVGGAGAVLLLAVYFLVAVQRWRPEDVRTHVLNFIAAALLGVNSFVHHALPSALLNVLWCLIAVGGLMRRSGRSVAR